MVGTCVSRTLTADWCTNPRRRRTIGPSATWPPNFAERTVGLDESEDLLTGQMPGYTQAWWAILRDARVSDGALRLYLIIASHTRGHRNVAWPGQRRLMELSGQSESQLRRNLRALEEAGWVRTKRVGNRQVNRYAVMMPRPQAVDDSVDDDVNNAVMGESDRSPMTGPDRSPMTGPKREVEEIEVTPLTPRRAGGRREGPLQPDERADDFAVWYDAYPRKSARADAEKAWRKHHATVPPLDSLLWATRWLSDRTQREQPQTDRWAQYMPYPATFLRGRRWEDATEAEPVVVARRPNPCVLCGSRDPREKCLGVLRVDMLFNEATDCPWRT